MKNNMKLYGLDDRFRALASMYSDFVVGRILSQEKGLYRVITEFGEKLAEISGKFRYETECLSDYPAVGDFVMVDWNHAGGNAVIHHILPRKSCFTRKAAGQRREQVVAANVDTLFLCMALNNDFNLRRLERYLTIGWDSGANKDGKTATADFLSGMMKSIPPMNELFEQAGMELPSFLGTKVEEAIEPEVLEVVPEDAE